MGIKPSQITPAMRRLMNADDIEGMEWQPQNPWTEPADEANIQDRSAGTIAEPQPIVLHPSDGAGATQEAHSARFHVRVTGYTTRPLDPDNACAKYHIDCLRYAGIIPDDTPEIISVETKTLKCATVAEERVEIEVLEAIQ